jgi:hypothetical protein
MRNRDDFEDEKFEFPDEKEAKKAAAEGDKFEVRRYTPRRPWP